MTQKILTMNEGRLKTLLKLIMDNDTEYAQRTSLVYQALATASVLGFPCGIRYDEKEGVGRPVVCIELPEVGEVAWHCKAYEKPYVAYDNEEKFKRIKTYITPKAGGV